MAEANGNREDVSSSEDSASECEEVELVEELVQDDIDSTMR